MTRPPVTPPPVMLCDTGVCEALRSFQYLRNNFSINQTGLANSQLHEW